MYRIRVLLAEEDLEVSQKVHALFVWAGIECVFARRGGRQALSAAAGVFDLIVSNREMTDERDDKNHPPLKLAMPEEYKKVFAKTGVKIPILFVDD